MTGVEGLIDASLTRSSYFFQAVCDPASLIPIGGHPRRTLLLAFPL